MAMRFSPFDLGRIIFKSCVSWFRDDAPSMGAAIAFYTLFAVTPILLIFIWAAGEFIAPQIVQDQILQQLRVLLGGTAEAAVRALLISARAGERGGLSTAAGLIALFVGATSVFAELQNALQRIWRTPASGMAQGLWQMLRGRLLAFVLMLGAGLLLLVSLTASAGLRGLKTLLGQYVGYWEGLIVALDGLLGLGLATLLFAMIYKYVPRDEIAWGDVWVGSGVTAVLFTAGKWMILFYLAHASFTSVYGVAGSFLVFLLWVYYSAQIFLLGAEFTRNFAYEQGSRTGRATGG